MSHILENQIKSLDLKQNAIKILINSFYGAFGNRYFYFHNNDIAQSITLQGQDLIKFSIKAVNHYFQNKWHVDAELHQILGISNMKINQIKKEAAIYTDTDSVYVCFDYALQSVEGLSLDNKKSLEFCLALNRHRLNDYFKLLFEENIITYDYNDIPIIINNEMFEELTIKLYNQTSTLEDKLILKKHFYNYKLKTTADKEILADGFDNGYEEFCNALIKLR